MRNCVRAEFEYLWSSKLLAKVFFSLIAVMIFSLWTNYSYISSVYQNYIHTYNLYVEHGEDIESALKSEYIENGVGLFGEGVTTIENPLAYNYAMMSRLLYIVSENYVTEQFLEYGNLFFPLIFGIFGILISIYDIKNKTFKIKTVRYGKLTLVGAKLLVLIVSIIMMFFAAVIINQVIGRVVNNIMMDKNNFESFKIEEYVKKGNILVKLLFSVVLSMVYALIGYMLSTLIRNNIVSTAVIFVYILVMPIVFRYELKNMFLCIAKKVFDCIGSYSITGTLYCDLMQSLFGIFIYIVLTIIVILIVSKKRSSYTG